MSIIYVLIPIAILLVIIAISVFFWAVRTNQFEDLERQGYSILFDDDVKKASSQDEAKLNPQSNTPKSSDNND